MKQNCYDLTIIIPMYNCEDYIDRCIESIINQKDISVEIVLINDGSTDNTLSKVLKYCNEYENIKLINQKNRGVSYARNIGIENANGKYILFVDSDDYLIKDSLQSILKMAKEDYDIIRFSYVIKNKNKEQRVIFEEMEYNTYDEKKIFINNFLSNSYENMVWGQLIKKDLLKNVMFDEKIFYAEDFLFNYELYEKATKIKYTSKIVYSYEKNEKSITMNFSNKKTLEKIENLEYVFGKIINKNQELILKKQLEINFLKELMPQIMMLVFDKNMSKKEILEQYKNFLKQDLFIRVSKDIETEDLKKYKYLRVYKNMKKSNVKEVYNYAQIYKWLKKMQYISYKINK